MRKTSMTMEPAATMCALIFQYRLINKEMMSETIAPATNESIQLGIPNR